MRYVTQRSVFRIVDADADKMSEHYGKTLSPAKVEPLEQGRRISVEDRHYSTGRFSIWNGKCHSGMKVTFSEPSEAYVLYLPVSGAMEINTGRRLLTSAPGTGLIGDMSRFEKLTIYENRSHIGIAFDKAAVVAQLSELLDAPVLERINLATTLEMTSDIGSRLAAIGGLLWDLLDDEDTGFVSVTAIEHLFQAIMVMMLESIPHNYTSRLNRSASPAMPRNVKRP